jgi:hypothetical protein
VKKVNELFVGMPVEDERTAIGMKRHFQDAAFRTGRTGVGETVAIGVRLAQALTEPKLAP